MNEEQMRCSSHTLNAKLPQVSRLVSLKIFFHLILGFYKSQLTSGKRLHSTDKGQAAQCAIRQLLDTVRNANEAMVLLVNSSLMTRRNHKFGIL
jgi:hypothetical protein